MQHKFYQDYETWLDHWLQQNVGDEPANLRTALPNDLMNDTLLLIAVARVFNYINYRCRYLSERWAKIPPQQKTADIFYCSRWKISRAIKKYSNLM